MVCKSMSACAKALLRSTCHIHEGQEFDFSEANERISMNESGESEVLVLCAKPAELVSLKVYANSFFFQKLVELIVFRQLGRQ